MEKFIHGMDISSMDEVVGLGGKYYDKGEERELTDILKSYAMGATPRSVSTVISCL